MILDTSSLIIQKMGVKFVDFAEINIIRLKEMYRPYAQYDAEEDEEPLVEEFDPNFEPDEEEIKMYAVQALGMDLPEDNMYLHLAKEALKKPLPQSWGAFQRSDGQVYYKHKVTQQKITDHPIDVEYRRLLQQEKDKAARRTLKSKANKPAGFAAMKLLGNIARDEELGTNPLLSNISGLSDQSNIDLQRQLENELTKYQRSLQKDFELFQSKEQRQQFDRQRKLKESHQEELDRLTRNSMMPISFEERLKQQKNSIRKQIEEQQQQTFKREIKDEEERLKREVVRTERDLEGEWQLKLREIEERNSQKIQAKGNQIQKAKEDIQTEKVEREKKRKNDIERARAEFEKNKQDFEEEANTQLELQIQKISKQTAERLRQKKNELEAQYIRLRKLLKSSPQDRIKELIEKKTRLQEISNKKFESYRAKQLQLVEKDAKMSYQKQKQRISEKWQRENQKLEAQFIDRQEDKLRKYIEQLTKEYTNRLNSKQKDIFQKFKQKLSTFQLNKNKSLIDARQKFISEIEGKKGQMQKDNALNSIKLLIRQREFDITNHEKLIKSLRSEIKLQQRKLKKYDLDRKLYRLKDEQEITDVLKHQIGILKEKKLSNQKDPLPAVFQQHQLKLQELKRNLNYDQNVLGKVLNHLQSTSILPFYERKKIMNSDLPSDIQSEKLQALGHGKNELVKKYNIDVRKLRENQKMINEYQQILKKAEYDQETALGQLRSFQTDYKVPELRSQLEAEGSDGGLVKLKQYLDKTPAQNFSVNPDLVSTKRVKDIFQDHSRFLMNIKQQLNSKLWEIRGMGHYSRRF